jgi:hypothetical protein
MIVVSVSDASGNMLSSNVPLSIVDTTPPVINSLVASPNVLSPPNHQLVPITVSASVSDNCDAAPVTKIVSITCDQTFSPGDIQISGNLTAKLAASKGASGTDRVYTITVQSTDVSGNSSSGLITVKVPKSSGGSLLGSLGTRNAFTAGSHLTTDTDFDNDRERNDHDRDDNGPVNTRR